VIAGGRGLTPEATVQAMSRYATVPATDFGQPATIASNRFTEQGDTMTTKTHSLNLVGVGPVELTIDDLGEGQPFLLLHGGGGQTLWLASRTAREHPPSSVIYPTHPGFGGTPRPEALNSVRGLAELYVALLDQLDLSDVTVVGNSIGGWVAAEMGLLQSPRLPAPLSSTPPA